MFAIENTMGSKLFSLFRVYLGLYLFIIFITSYVDSVKIWSSEGIVPTPDLNLNYGVFPNILIYFDSPAEIKIVLIVLAITSLVLALGFQRTWIALLLWYGWTCLFNRNILTLNPSINYIGWLLIACTIIPTGEKYSLSKAKENWGVPSLIILGAWIVFALGYTISGYDKCHSLSWVNGTALSKILSGPLGFSVNNIFLDALPEFLFKALSWLVVAVELLCAPLSLFSVTRKWAWLLATILQIGILFTLDIAPIVFGMFTIHIFIFNPTWFRVNILKRMFRCTKTNSQMICYELSIER